MANVQLAVYDLSRGMARAMSKAILGQQIEGIWHTGIVVFGKEYYFGGGIQVSPWGFFAQSNGMNPSQILELGQTQKTQNELENYLRSINDKFTQYTYDLINNNCNNFADVVSNFLIGKGIPSHIVDLPKIVFSTPGGAMLRPMIEQMQNNIKQQHGHGLDPFGKNETSNSSDQGVRFEKALSDSVTSLALNAMQNSSNFTPSKLEETSLVSADISTVSTIGKKLINIKGPDGFPGTALSEAEKEVIMTIIAKLNTAHDKKAKDLFTIEDYIVIEKILANHPEGHMSSLFLLRLMFLHDHVTDFSRLEIVREITKRLLLPTTNNSSTTVMENANFGIANGFASIPAHVMALCSISNLLSHDNGVNYLLGDSATDLTNKDTSYINDLIDTVLRGLTHNSPEVRQMSITLGYNLTLNFTKNNELFGVWKASFDPTNPELHQHALQLICGSLEGISDEKDIIVRKRRLAIICRILRSYKSIASDLLQDLGYDNFLYSLSSIANPALTTDEADILTEILYYLKK